jgi:hypothetical protein
MSTAGYRSIRPPIADDLSLCEIPTAITIHMRLSRPDWATRQDFVIQGQQQLIITGQCPRKGFGLVAVCAENCVQTPAGKLSRSTSEAPRNIDAAHGPQKAPRRKCPVWTSGRALRDAVSAVSSMAERLLTMRVLGVAVGLPFRADPRRRSGCGYPVQLGTAGTLPRQLFVRFPLIGELLLVMVPPWR